MTSAGEGRRASARFTWLGARFRLLSVTVPLRNTPVGRSERCQRPGQPHGEDRAPALGSAHGHRATVGLGHRAHDRQPQAAAAAAVAGLAGEALEHALAHGRRHAGPAVRHLEHDLLAGRGAPTPPPGCPEGVWMSAFSTRLSTSRCRSSGDPWTVRSSPSGSRSSVTSWPERSGAASAHGVAGDRSQVDGATDRCRGARRARRRRRPGPAAAGRRRAVASGATSAARSPRSRPRPRDRAGRRCGRALPPAARGWPGCWSGACAAHGRRRPRTRAGAPARTRSPPGRHRAGGACPPACAASSATSSLASGRGSDFAGSRVRATSRAARVSPAIGRMARRATAKPARKARPGAAEDPQREEEVQPVDGALHAGPRLGVLDERPRRPRSGRGPG